MTSDGSTKSEVSLLSFSSNSSIARTAHGLYNNTRVIKNSGGAVSNFRSSRQTRGHPPLSVTNIWVSSPLRLATTNELPKITSDDSKQSVILVPTPRSQEQIRNYTRRKGATLQRTCLDELNIWVSHSGAIVIDYIDQGSPLQFSRSRWKSNFDENNVGKGLPRFLRQYTSYSYTYPDARV